MGNELSQADVAEGVRATIAAYTQALDDGLTDDVDRHLSPPTGPAGDVLGLERLEGQAALREAYGVEKPGAAPALFLVW